MVKTHKQMLKQLERARERARKKLEKLDEGFSPSVKAFRQIKRTLKRNEDGRK